jgi:hypothetical protein
MGRRELTSSAPRFWPALGLSNTHGFNGTAAGSDLAGMKPAGLAARSNRSTMPPSHRTNASTIARYTSTVQADRQPAELEASYYREPGPLCARELRNPLTGARRDSLPKRR